LSDVAALANVPGTPQELAEWSFAHAVHHIDIVRVIYQITKIALPIYVLDPIDINNPQVWADQHQQMHTQMDQILGISGFNLDDWDWKNKSTLASNVWNNFQEHLQASETLEIG
jgi:hypothetical protein